MGQRRIEGITPDLDPKSIEAVLAFLHSRKAQNPSAFSDGPGGNAGNYLAGVKIRGNPIDNFNGAIGAAASSSPTTLTTKPLSPPRSAPPGVPQGQGILAPESKGWPGDKFAS